MALNCGCQLQSKSQNMKLNKSTVDSIPLVASGQKIYRDSDLIGFAVRATTKSKVYIVERRADGRLYRITIGKTNEIAAAEARKQAQVLLAQIASGEYQKQKTAINNNPTFQQAFDLYLKHRKLKPLSINTYHHCINTFLSDWLEKPIFDIGKTEAFNKFLELTDYSPSQANLTLKMFGSIWRFAQVHYSTDENPILKHNPVDVVPAKRGWNRLKARTRHLGENDIVNFHAAVLKYKNEKSLISSEAKNAVRDLVLFIMYTGCRRNEARTLRWENVDINKGEFIFIDPKNGDDHHLPMGDKLWQIMKDRYAQRESEWVFPASRLSKKGYLAGAEGLLQVINDELGTAISLHDLRRTFATICNHLNYGPYTIKRLLNHRSGAIGDVTGGYVQVSKRKLRAAMNDIEAVYAGEKEYFD